MYLGPAKKVRNATGARRQGEAANFIMHTAGNEADVVFLTNEKTVIINNPLCARIGLLARNSLHLRFYFYTQLTRFKMTQCF
jgi:hypothetical protein